MKLLHEKRVRRQRVDRRETDERRQGDRRMLVTNRLPSHLEADRRDGIDRRVLAERRRRGPGVLAQAAIPMPSQSKEIPWEFLLYLTSWIILLMVLLGFVGSWVG